MKIENLEIGINSRPVIIAEMSGNHNQSLEKALNIVESAAKTGAQLLKLQTYTADTITLDIKENEFFISDENNIWKGQSLYDLYKIAHTPWEWHKPIMQRATELGMLCFSAPFDETAVDFLEDLNVPAYKIASPECIDLPLIRKVASTGKPMIISTGMARVHEIAEAVEVVREAGLEDFALLKCTASYPASPEDSNVLTIPHMRAMFQCEVGLSDHTMGCGAAAAAIAHGATLIEKHFTLDRQEGGVDSVFSLEPDEFRNLIIETERAWESLGKIKYGPTTSEGGNFKGRPSLYVTEDIKCGEKFTTGNIKSIRPGYGLPPKYYELILGRTAKKSLLKGTPLSWDLF